MGDWLYRLQFVNWFPIGEILNSLKSEWIGFRIREWDGAYSKMFTCSIHLGFFEIRVWRKNTRPKEPENDTQN